MKTPPLLLGASLMFWGWQTRLLFIALPLSVILEGARYVKIKWDFKQQDFNRVSDLCTVFFFISAIYPYLSDDSNLTVLVALKLLPLSLSPLIISQFFSTSEQVDISTLFIMFRRFKKNGIKDHPSALNLSYPYVSVCVLSASVANQDGPGFFICFLMITSWALFTIRSKRVSPVLWSAVLVLIFSTGYMGQKGIKHLQTAVERATTEWFFRYFTKGDVDPYSRVTAIGDIGELKMSDRIVFRVKPKDVKKVPGLLYEAVYNIYLESSWYASRYLFEEILPNDDMVSWTFSECQDDSEEISVYAYLQNGKGILKLPKDICKIENLPVGLLEKNRYGAVKVDKGPGMVRYKAYFGNHPTLFDLPNERDLFVPNVEIEGIETFLETSSIDLSSPGTVVRTLTSHFYNNFSYSLSLEHDNKKQTPLADFLLSRKKGHCEYFASATVLILRVAGIPSRYVTGYAVQEYSPLENCFVVRARHAHAWALAYVNDKWIYLDTTPPSWIDIENEAASVWESVNDFFSWVGFNFSRFRWLLSDERIKDHLVWLLIPLVLFLIKRTFFDKNISSVKKRINKPERKKAVSEKTSEFYRIENAIRKMGYERYKWESYTDWINRIQAGVSKNIEIEPLFDMLDLHYELRFNPGGFQKNSQDCLADLVEKWLEKNIS